MDASEINSKRLNAKEVIFLKENGNSFSSRRKTNQICWRRSGTENIHLDTGTPNSRRMSKRDFLGESDGSPPPPPQDSSSCVGEARNDFWSISGNYSYRHHVEPRVKLYVPRDEPFPIPLRYIDVTRATSTTLDVMLGRRTDDYWNIEGDRDQFTILDEKPPEGNTWSGRPLTKKQTTSRPNHLWPEIWKNMSDAAKRK